MTQEARRIGAHHHGFLSDYLARDMVGVEIFVQSYGLQQPGGVELWCVKLQLHVALDIAGEHGVPQCRLNVAFAQCGQ